MLLYIYTWDVLLLLEEYKLVHNKLCTITLCMIHYNCAMLPHEKLAVYYSVINA